MIQIHLPIILLPFFCNRITAIDEADPEEDEISQHHRIRDRANHKQVLQNEIIYYCNKDNPFGILGLVAAANVLGRTVYSVYPDIPNIFWREILHRRFEPVKPTSREPVAVMWTYHGTGQLQPNHFVSLVW